MPERAIIKPVRCPVCRKALWAATIQPLRRCSVCLLHDDLVDGLWPNNGNYPRSPERD